MCRALETAAKAFGIDTCWQWKPVLDGKKVMKVVGLTQGGPKMAKLMEVVVDWQLANPSGTEEECSKWLAENHAVSSQEEEKKA